MQKVTSSDKDCLIVFVWLCTCTCKLRVMREESRLWVNLGDNDVNYIYIPRSCEESEVYRQDLRECSIDEVVWPSCDISFPFYSLLVLLFIPKFRIPWRWCKAKVDTRIRTKQWETQTNPGHAEISPKQKLQWKIRWENIRNSPFEMEIRIPHGTWMSLSPNYTFGWV